MSDTDAARTPYMRGDELGPCPCGHRRAMCHRVNAATWCGGEDDPFEEGVRKANVALADRVDTLEAERDAAVKERDEASDALQALAADHYFARAERAEARVDTLKAEIAAAKEHLREFEHVEGEPLSETAAVAAQAYAFLKHRADNLAKKEDA